MRAIKTWAVVACVLAPCWCFAASPTSGTVTLPSGEQLGYMVQGLGAPSYAWWYGCSPTSVGMMMGYYDRSGYAGLYYPNLVPGGVAEANSFGNPGALVNGIIASPGHIADFYAGGYNAICDDKPAPHHAFDCLADFMGTSQDLAKGINPNGGTSFYYYDDGSKLTFSATEALGIDGLDGMHGVGEYVQYSGYDFYDPNPTNVNDDMLYSQLTYDIFGYGAGFNGFTFADFEAEINAGRPVIVQIEGHTMLGYDYNADTNQIMVYDTWAPSGQNPGIMTWNGTYSGMQMYGVMVFEPSGGTVPEPATLGLLALGGVTLIVQRYRRRRLVK